MSADLSRMRKEYEAGALDEAELGDSPWPLFRAWLDEAVGRRDLVPEPTAMTLATVGPDGRPSTRVVLLKDADEHGLVWYTNYLSRKGRELAGNPHAAIQFHWVALERVLRIEGKVEKAEGAAADAYYASRPLAARIGAWASEQSEPISSRAVLVARAAEFGLKFGVSPPRPPHWGGYRLVPDRFEFWQGRTSRLHDRIRYRRDETGRWNRDRLAP
ncbi:MAG: pyridoxamine 5'-phosphate oxidase [Burkholderiaceae bacterium]